jgi:hypothetical protein
MAGVGAICSLAITKWLFRIAPTICNIILFINSN